MKLKIVFGRFAFELNLVAVVAVTVVTTLLAPLFLN